MCDLAQNYFDYINYDVIFYCSQISAFLLLFVGLFIFTNKKFTKHPYPLISFSLLINSMDFFSRYSNILVC